MFGVNDHTQIQQLGLLRGKLVVVAHSPQEIFCHGQPRLRPVEGEADIQDGEREPMDGHLIYRGIDIVELINGFTSENRFGYAETPVPSALRNPRLTSHRG